MFCRQPPRRQHAALSRRTAVDTSPAAVAAAAGRVVDITFDMAGPLGILLEETPGILLHGVRVRATRPGSYARERGLPVDSLIVAVAGTPVEGLEFADIIERLNNARRPLSLRVEMAAPALLNA